MAGQRGVGSAVLPAKVLQNDVHAPVRRFWLGFGTVLARLWHGFCRVTGSNSMLPTKREMVDKIENCTNLRSMDLLTSRDTCELRESLGVEVESEPVCFASAACPRAPLSLPSSPRTALLEGVNEAPYVGCPLGEPPPLRRSTNSKKIVTFVRPPCLVCMRVDRLFARAFLSLLHIVTSVGEILTSDLQGTRGISSFLKSVQNPGN